jgi:4,5-DOPA dioxygenase extradiol
MTEEETAMLPSLFLSHGAPTLIISDVPARRFLAGLGARYDRPKAVLIASPHWETERPTVNAVETNETIHDFGGFPDALYRMRYPAPGSPELADRVTDLLCSAGLAGEVDRRRGLDHGAWAPLKIAYPEADIPVVELSVQSRLGPAHHLQVGRALAPLRGEGVLVVGSGSFTHNLRELRWGDENAAIDPEWVTQFVDWDDAALTDGRTCDLLTYRRQAPQAVRNHPSEEHFLPLFVALGAGGEGAAATRLHASTTFGALRMDAYAFN